MGRCCLCSRTANEKALASELRALCRISSPVLPCACLVTPVPVDEQTQVQGTVRVLELGKSTVRKFTRLESKFASLVCNLKTTTEKKGIRPERLHSFLEVRLNQKIEFFSSTTVSDLFESITPYYCFLNTTLLENIIDEFLGEPLQQQLDEYEGLLEDFTCLLKEIYMKTVAKHKGMPGLYSLFDKEHEAHSPKPSRLAVRMLKFIHKSNSSACFVYNRQALLRSAKKL